MNQPVIFFDLGKTLCHPGTSGALRDPGALSAVCTLLANEGWRIPRWRLTRALLKTYFGYLGEARATNRERQAVPLAQNALVYAGVSAGAAGMLAEAMARVICQRAAARSRLYPGVNGALAELDGDGRRLAVITDGVYDRAYVEALLGNLGVRSKFISLTLSSEVGRRKPDAAIFETACREAGADPRQSIFIGDKEDNDIRGAHEFGMRAVLFRPRFSLKFSHADAVMRSWSELPDIISKMMPLSDRV